MTFPSASASPSLLCVRDLEQSYHLHEHNVWWTPEGYGLNEGVNGLQLLLTAVLDGRCTWKSDEKWSMSFLDE